MPAVNPTMTSKRKSDDGDGDRGEKRPRLRQRSLSEPVMNDSENDEKRQALIRLFGRICSVELNENRPHTPEMEEEEEAEEDPYADDPLLDTVPVDMDPEQLGFLVCAQETLRFLHTRGLPVKHPVFARLRFRLMRGVGQMGAA